MKINLLFSKGKRRFSMVYLVDNLVENLHVSPFCTCVIFHTSKVSDRLPHYLFVMTLKVSNN